MKTKRHLTAYQRSYFSSPSVIKQPLCARRRTWISHEKACIDLMLKLAEQNSVFSHPSKVGLA